MNLSSAEFLIQEAFTGIRRNGLMAFASISTIALSLGILGAFVLVAFGANQFIASQIGKFEIAVYMNENATEQQTREVADKIAKIKDVANVAVLSKEEEWAQFKRANPNIESAGLQNNPLPYAIDIKVTDASRTTSIANKVRLMAGVHTVRDGREELARIMALARVVRGVSVSGVVVLLITATFIISNAIKLTLYARRREIRIMKLVGATNWFVRVPLIIEGIVFGAIGAFAAWALLRLGGAYVSQTVERLPFMAQFTCDIPSSILALSLIALGVVIGATGSFVSIRRFLNDT
ncbi:MAG: ABC transporter permease [Armatimonadetes bacterium]|nr:ABC transporter permease [Armatimonadota bacterium]